MNFICFITAVYSPLLPHSPLSQSLFRLSAFVVSSAFAIVFLILVINQLFHIMEVVRLVIEANCVQIGGEQR